MRKHPTFYVGRLRPYYQYEPVSRGKEHLRGREPIPPSSGPVLTSHSVRQANRPVHVLDRCPDEQQPSHHEENESNVRSQVAQTQKRHDRPKDRASGNCNNPLQDPEAHNAESVREAGHRVAYALHEPVPKHQDDSALEPDQVFPPPPHYWVDSSGGQRVLVKRILNHRDVNGVRTSYLVRWRGYPPAWDSWEPRAQLIVDVLGLIEQHDETQPLRSKKGRRKKTSPNASTGNGKFQSLRPSRKRYAPSSRYH
uniref:Chromo domain-containing protein n=1 Tax=Peronospora matthiolae TaxID=2874970 RepID=A0AAV1ULW1_9STRA